MSRHVHEYFRGLLAVLVGSGITISELITNGSLVLTFLGGALAVLGGFWTYRTSRTQALTALTQARTAEVELKIKEIELRRAARESHDPFRPAA